MLFLFTSRQYRKWAKRPIETSGKKANVESGRDIAILGRWAHITTISRMTEGQEGVEAMKKGASEEAPR